MARPRNPYILIESMAVTIGTRLGAYEVTALLGQGGMDMVYQARDRQLQRDVALRSWSMDSVDADGDGRGRHIAIHGGFSAGDEEPLAETSGARRVW